MGIFEFKGKKCRLVNLKEMIRYISFRGTPRKS